MKPLLPRDFTGVCLMALAFTLLAAAASAAKVDDFPRARIALVGGTFINDALLKSEGILEGSFTIKTKAGVSPTIWYGETGGGRFETAAEVRMMGLWGGDLVTMSIGTEMTYARMMGIHYAALVSISNPAEGVGDWDWETLKGVYPRINPLSLGIVLAAIPRIAAIGDEVPRVGDALRFHPEMTSGQAADEKK
ncbi:MAG: hypothetical protein AB1651_13890 [Pseudomonadota bacterium]